MPDYVLLLRGINVGGKNKIKMAELRDVLEREGFSSVQTYIQSGNVVLRSQLSSTHLSRCVEKLLVENFTLDSRIIRILALTREEMRGVVCRAPEDFGADYDTYRYSVIFCMDNNAEDVLEQLPVRRDIDSAWTGPGVVYYRHPSLANPNAGKSHFSKVIGQRVYATLTIRNWNTTGKLLDILDSQ